MEENTIMPVSSPQNYRFIALKGSLGDLIGGNEELSIPELQRAVGGEKSLLYCLIKNESSWRTNVVGDGGKAYGLLQFHRPTFDRYSKRYGLTLDYKNPLDQIILASLMINEDINNVHHWSVWHLCL
jgi:soluble lytic murein transglycosylase-like protein